MLLECETNRWVAARHGRCRFRSAIQENVGYSREGAFASLSIRDAVVEVEGRLVANQTREDRIDLLVGGKGKSWSKQLADPDCVDLARLHSLLALRIQPLT
jgi:hypothetical protein